jgi:two-component system, OmpR family, response regulator ResD
MATILVVDDEPNIREVVGLYLRRDGHTVVSAADGDEALRLNQMHRPDLVVLDLMLPRLNGLEVCRRIQAERRVPLIMLTARGEEEDRIIGLGVGADDYVTKPFSPRELAARVAAVLRRVNEATAVRGGEQDRSAYPRGNRARRAGRADGTRVRSAALSGDASQPGLYP